MLVTGIQAVGSKGVTAVQGAVVDTSESTRTGFDADPQAKRAANGRARPSREICELAGQLPEFSVFVVEVCLGCGWNHLVTSAILGTCAPQPRRRRSGSPG